MWNVDVRKLIAVFVFLFIGDQDIFCQGIAVNTDEIESLIDEWNAANNTRNLHSFEKVYGNRVIYFGEEIPRNEALSKKRQLFRENPGFRQRITTEITYAPFSSRVVKCSFTREVLEKTRWKKYPSFLLVSYENNRYVIVGENNAPTNIADRQKQAEDSGTVERQTQSDDRADSLTAFSPPVLPPMEHPDSLDDVASIPDTSSDTSGVNQHGFAGIDALFSDPLSMGMISIPRSYVFYLIALLGAGGLMIFIADSIQSRKRRRVRAPVSHDEAEHIVRDFRVQAAFESFVITLFDPLYFKSYRPKTEYVYAGKTVAAEKGPDLILDYRQKDAEVRFAITCQYYYHTAKNEVQLLSRERQEFIRQFEADRGMDVYYVLGFGGKPDDPRELFFIPAKDVHDEYITRSQLRHYSKSGMFYYNRRTGRIQ